MVELTEQEKLERRRQKRQQRILQSGESRLGKITGTAFPNRASVSPSPSPSPSTSSINKPASVNTPPSFRTQRRDSDDPSEELGAPQPLNDMNAMMNQQFASMFGGISGIPGSEGNAFSPAAALMANGAHAEGQQANMDPFQQLFANAAAAQGGQGGFNPAALLATMAGGGGAEQPMTEEQQKIDRSQKYWNLLHFIMMIILGFYAVYTEWTRAGSERFASLLSSNASVANYPAIHVPLFWYFITIELGLQSARLFYQQGTMPPTSTIATLATQLPHPLGSIITIFLRYRLIWTCLSQDICILVFIIGLSQVISNVF
ncbi:hypothetical protein HMPREF1544_11183 [Mucor circinelloides 1006PhL]|uniref:Golgi to ER traffic protein 2 n=1 Tax=Mucor circinelloides f. circinelloides (strain 1006PhL) TaxID=1220926 RepID=S2IWM6_MUCC1|nr:hypothetical protein HMPREF1544_11183 [Mucor circinelloides 1006PhL]